MKQRQLEAVKNSKKEGRRKEGGIKDEEEA